MIKLVLSFWLIGVPGINIYGAPISTFFSTVVIVALNLYFIIKNSGRLGSISKMFVKPFVSAFLAVAVGVGFYMLLDAFLDAKIVILTVIIIVALIYSITIIKLKVIDKEEILMLPKGETIIKILRKIHLL